MLRHPAPWIGLVLDRPAKPVMEALLTRGFLVGTSSDPQVLRLGRVRLPIGRGGVVCLQVLEESVLLAAQLDALAVHRHRRDGAVRRDLDLGRTARVRAHVEAQRALRGLQHQLPLGLGHPLLGGCGRVHDLLRLVRRELVETRPQRFGSRAHHASPGRHLD